jgi:hypothetical protein
MPMEKIAWTVLFKLKRTSVRPFWLCRRESYLSRIYSLPFAAATIVARAREIGLGTRFDAANLWHLPLQVPTEV